jgi:hypothetical protein
VQNSFWFFDQQKQGAIRVDAQLRKLSDTGRLDLLLNISPSPIAMQEYDNRLYIHDPTNGILVFDLFGTYVRTIPILDVENFEVRGNVIYYFQGGTAFVYDMISFAIQEIPLPTDLRDKVLEVRIERSHLYLRTKDRIIIDPIPSDQ